MTKPAMVTTSPPWHYRRLSQPWLKTGDRLVIAGDTQRVHCVMLLSADDALPEQWMKSPDYAPLIASLMESYATVGRLDHHRIDTPEGPSFFRACWQVMQGLKAGETISYQTLAERAGKPQAIRAAASACARNPLPILIPCHRILRSDGAHGSFVWGTSHKAALLSHEQICRQ